MSMTTTEFCRKLVENVPEVSGILREHIADNDELLPHVFLGDVTRYVLADGKARSAIVKFLDESFDQYGPDVEELIAVSFVEYLVDPVELTLATKGLDAPKIVSEWNRQRTSQRFAAKWTAPAVKKAVNSDIIHASEQAVERGVFPDAKSAAEGLRALSKKFKTEGLPVGTIPDPKRADSVLVPFGNGRAVYEIMPNGTAVLRTVLGPGT